MKNVYFIGGTSSFSNDIAANLQTHYGHSITSVSRKTGHTIPSETNKIISEALNFEVIILYTYAGGHQLGLLFDLYKEIELKKWNGVLINFGSSVVLHNKSSTDKTTDRCTTAFYQTQKKAMQETGHYISRHFTSNSFKFTQIQCGMLANDKMKKLPNYRETCLQSKDVAELINFIISAPANWHLHEIIIDGK